MTDEMAMVEDSPAPPPNEALNYTLALVMIGVSIAVVVGMFTTAYVGGFCLTGILVCAAVVRFIANERGPRGLAVRTRTVDVTTLLVLAAVMGTFSQLIVNI